MPRANKYKITVFQCLFCKLSGRATKTFKISQQNDFFKNTQNTYKNKNLKYLNVYTGQQKVIKFSRTKECFFKIHKY